jgi:hypothetical protein
MKPDEGADRATDPAASATEHSLVATHPVAASDVVPALQNAMPEARKRFHVRDLAVFGSIARGEGRDASDVDVLDDFEGPTTFDDFMGLRAWLEDLLGRRIDLVTRAALKPRLRARIEAEARRVA